MANFKVIGTITWKLEKDMTREEALEYAKLQFDDILDKSPHGEDFDGFSIQVDLAKMRDRKKLIHLGEFELDEVLPYVGENVKREYSVNDKTYHVRMNSQRYLVFKNSPKCVSCCIEGNKMVLDINPKDQSPHFNLYAKYNGRLVLMTKDHILPKSRGGKDILTNYETMCALCNNLKGNSDITHDQLRELRSIYDNESKLTKKELRDLLNKKRSEMIKGDG